MYDIEILCFLSPSFVSFLALFQALPLTTNLLSLLFEGYEIWVPVLTMIEEITDRLTHAHSIQ